MSKASQTTLGVGIIGCGNISATYLRLAPLFTPITIVAVADLRDQAAQQRAEQFGVEARSVDQLLSDPRIDIVVNLTIPAAHADVTMRALASGKHIYSEKPFVLSVAEGLQVRELANQQGLRVGSAPDTFLGGAHQAARDLVDGGRIGRVTSGTCHVMSHGMESWHPNPDFFYQPGGGPVFDIGPYYLTNLIQLLGPVRRVAALAGRAHDERTITSSQRAGQTIKVNTPTDIHALLEFEQGASITMSASWDVWAHRHAPMELYGTEGSLYVPDPNFFGGELQLADPDGTIEAIDVESHPLGRPNEADKARGRANYRTVGLADMAQAIIEDRPHRCSLDLAVHVVDVMACILRSGETGTFQHPTTTCERPQSFPAQDAQALMR